MSLTKYILASQVITSAGPEKDKTASLAIVHESVAGMVEFAPKVRKATWSANNAVKENILQISGLVNDYELFDQVLLIFPFTDYALQLSPKLVLFPKESTSWEVFENIINFARSLTYKEVVVAGNNLKDDKYYRKGGGAKSFSQKTNEMYVCVPVLDSPTPQTSDGVTLDLSSVVISTKPIQST